MRDLRQTIPFSALDGREPFRHHWGGWNLGVWGEEARRGRGGARWRGSEPRRGSRRGRKTWGRIRKAAPRALDARAYLPIAQPAPLSSRQVPVPPHRLRSPHLQKGLPVSPVANLHPGRRAGRRLRGQRPPGPRRRRPGATTVVVDRLAIRTASSRTQCAAHNLSKPEVGAHREDTATHKA